MTTLSSVSLLALLSAISLGTPALATLGHQPITIPRPANPYADPKHDPYNPMKYIASNALTGIAVALVLSTTLLQTLWTFKWGGKFMLAMVIGGYTFSIGLASRFGLHQHPESKGLYIFEYLFVVLSPCAFIAADYVLLGRLARYLRCDDYLLISPRKITRFFILSDVTTFLIQSVGGSVSVSANNLKMNKLGSRIFLGGLAAQLLSFSCFTTIYIIFLYRVYKGKPEVFTQDSHKKWYNDWRSLCTALTISCIGILIRSAYRTVELSQGYGGRLSTSETFFYALDTLPLFLAIVVYVPFWPGRYIPAVPNEEDGVRSEPEKTATSSAEGTPTDSIERA